MDNGRLDLDFRWV